jgi:hypothetical protein
MPESGGPTTQSGILYQNSIAALFLGRLCDATSRPENDRVVHVRVETTDNIDDIVVTFADNHRTFIQAKEDVRDSDSAWKKLWEDFEKQFLSDTFVKGTDRLALWVGNHRDEHTNLRELCQRAISSGTYEEWQSRITKGPNAILGKIKALLHPELLEGSTLLSLFKHIEIEIHPFQSIGPEIIFQRGTSVFSRVVLGISTDAIGNGIKTKCIGMYKVILQNGVVISAFLQRV